MKHSIKITVILLIMFFISQLIGIGVANYYSPKVEQTIIENGTAKNVTSYNLPYGMNPPQGTDPKTNLKSIIVSIVIAVGLMLLLMRVRAEAFLRGWFFLVVLIAIAITINSFLFLCKEYSALLALVIALLLAFYKIFKRNLIVHNLTELIIYPGIASIFIPLLNILTISILLVIISIYDIYAVWHAGFMQKMAKYQMQKLKIFAGFFIPYIGKGQRKILEKMKNKKIKDKKIKLGVAILGGGDIVFPMILAGVILHAFGFLPALIISIGATIALALLFYFSEKGKFYPAMPFISAGCFVALGVNYLLGLV
jgi:presenilin-like A22 family membrane protease